MTKSTTKLLPSGSSFTQAAPEKRSGQRSWLGLAGFGFAALLEDAMLLLLFGVFTETMGLASDQYLSELPVVGPLFEMIDEDATVSHLLAFLLAVFSVAVPLTIWNTVLEEEIHLNPKLWLVPPMHRVKAVLGLSVYAVVVLLEVVNLYSLIAKQTAPSAFGPAHEPDALTAFLADNQGLGIVIALLIALVNTVLALITVRAARALHTSDKGE
jgi:hypothetical protein